ncbi:MAG: ATP-dependent 6-phosphofructokinase [Planctomycetota bacterium]|nr:ATP-dependent 6-phosphofructokinase [Planctomycetota bacterium]
MARRSKVHCIGILTSGGDCPGLNAAIRAVTKTAIHEYGVRAVGIHDGFPGLVENRSLPLDDESVSGILALGGTVLGTSRDKPHKMPMGGKVLDMTAVAVQNARRMEIDCLVCLGGGGTQKSAYRLSKKGLPVVTLPKTIDNDVAETDFSFGFDTAMCIATEAIDRLHTTATSHHRIIVCEPMGHRTGWLPLASGIAGGADVILIPEIPYDLEVVARYLQERRRTGKRFSIIAVAEGARSAEEVRHERQALARRKGKAARSQPVAGQIGELSSDEDRDSLPLVVRKVNDQVRAYHVVQEPMSSQIARRLQDLTGTEARVTTLGHVQRGGGPSAFDRMLCSLLGTKAMQLIAKGVTNVMVAYRGERAVPVPLAKVAGVCRAVPLDHPLIETARLVGTCMGDR